LLGLHRKERQGNDPDAIDLQPRRGALDRVGDKKIAGPTHRAQQCSKLGGDG
jgi:hypothetical protein